MLPDRHFADDLPPLEARDAIMPVMRTAFLPQYGEAWNSQQVLAQLLQPTATSVVTMPTGQGSDGFVMGRQTLDEMELLLFAVMPEQRNSGVGSALLSHFLEMCRCKQVNFVFLEMRMNNPALSLYEKFGFHKVGQRKNYYLGNDGQRYDACTMRVEIRPKAKPSN